MLRSAAPRGRRADLVVQLMGTHFWRAAASAAAAGGGGGATAPAAPRLPADGLSLAHFVAGGAAAQLPAPAPPGGRSVWIETYGCQQNAADSEVVRAVLAAAGYGAAASAAAADVVLLNTCAIRDNAEARVWGRLRALRPLRLRGAGGGGAAAAPAPVVGVLGCMAERLKTRLLETDALVDLVAGPDAYRDLPRLIDAVAPELAPKGGAEGEPAAGGAPRPARRRTAINVQLSLDESYADVAPVRQAGKASAYLSIMRGCNNLCAFCVVPFTRGRERSRPVGSILDELRRLSDAGVREVTLLGQNVNSYADASPFGAAPPPRAGAPPPAALVARWRARWAQGGEGAAAPPRAHYAPGFSSVYRPAATRAAPHVSFAELLDAAAGVDPELRVRFTSPHPKDFSADVLAVVAARPNVCSQLHVPAQSGATAVLARMGRGYTREAYDALIADARAAVRGVALSTDMIAGFCGETEDEHAASVDLLRRTRFDGAFLFAYSERPQTRAARRLADDVPPAAKAARLAQLMEAFRAGLAERLAAEAGRRHVVLVEGDAKARHGGGMLTGRTDTFKRVVFADAEVAAEYSGGAAAGRAPAPGAGVRLRPGDYAAVEVTGVAGGSLTGVALGRTTLTRFVELHGSAAPPLLEDHSC